MKKKAKIFSVHTHPNKYNKTKNNPGRHLFPKIILHE